MECSVISNACKSTGKCKRLDNYMISYFSVMPQQYASMAKDIVADSDIR